MKEAVQFDIVSRDNLPVDLRYGGKYGRLFTAIATLDGKNAICVPTNVLKVSSILYAKLKTDATGFEGVKLARRDGKLFIYRGEQ